MTNEYNGAYTIQKIEPVKYPSKYEVTTGSSLGLVVAIVGLLGILVITRIQNKITH